MSVEARFWAKVQKGSGCWLWAACVFKTGYGKFNREGRTSYAHRTTFEFHHRVSILRGVHACHRCDNRLCVRPDHIFLGSPQQNFDDMRAKGRERHRSPYGESHGQCRYSDHQVRTARIMHSQGKSIREITAVIGATDPTVRRWVEGQIRKTA